MSGTGQFPPPRMLGSPGHPVAPFARWMARRTQRRAWDRLEWAVADGSAADIGAAIDHLMEVAE